MDRRELLKSGLVLTAGVVTAGLSGCTKNVTEEKYDDFNSSPIPPAQKEKYKITTSMPFNIDLIDEMAEMNKNYKKSEIVSLYNNIPNPLFSEFDDFFASQRGKNENIKSYDDYAKYVKHAKDKGFKIVYLLNSPKPLSRNNFEKYRKKFNNLLDFIHDIGCDDIKVANTQVATLVNESKYNFKLSASTSFEYHNTLQYVNLVRNYPNIETFDIAIDENRNFPFLANLKKLFPDKNIEVIVNEPCVQGCPARISHASSMFCVYNCSKIRNITTDICRTGIIYPWNFAYYQNVGVSSFKILGFPVRSLISNLYYLRSYLDLIEFGVDNIKTIPKEIFPYKIRFREDISLRELISYLPDIRHFIKNGDKCASKCKAECNYCYECAEKIKELLV